METSPQPATDERSRAVESLLDILDRSPSGHAFIRETLRTIVRTWGLDDAAFVTGTGDARVVITRDGQPPRGRLADLVDAETGTGLVTHPPVPADAPKVWAVTHVAEVAIQLDREGWRPERDDRSGLANVNGFRREVLLARSRFEHGEHPFGLLVVDVDDVDLLDQRVRGRVIERTAAAVRDTLRRIDGAARIDDHRFGIVLEGADRTASRAFLRRLRDRITADPVLSTVGYRIGVASCPEDSLDTSAILRSATLRLEEGEVEMRALPGRRLDLVATVELGVVTTMPELPMATTTTALDFTVPGLVAAGDGPGVHRVIERTPPPVVPAGIADRPAPEPGTEEPTPEPVDDGTVPSEDPEAPAPPAVIDLRAPDEGPQPRPALAQRERQAKPRDRRWGFRR